MLKFSSLFFVFFSAYYSIGQGIADGFMKEKGQTDISVSYSFETFDTYFGADDFGITRNIQSVSFYAAHGITKRLDAIVALPYVNNTGEENLQDGTGLLRMQIAEVETKNVAYSFTAIGGYSMPLSDYPSQSAFAIGQQANAILARAILSVFWKTGYFIQVQSGFSWRSLPTPDSYPIIAKIGYAGAHNYFDIWFHRQEAQGGFDYRDGFDQPFSSFGVSFAKVGATYYKPIKPWIGVFVQGAYTFSGRNVGQAIRGSAGLSFKLQDFKRQN